VLTMATFTKLLKKIRGLTSPETKISLSLRGWKTVVFHSLLTAIWWHFRRETACDYFRSKLTLWVDAWL